MAFSSALHDDPRPFILDTSVLINLHASTRGERILSSIANDIVVARNAARELDHEIGRQLGQHDFLHDLSQKGEILVTDITEEETSLYGDLVSGPSCLGDGEAATIAIATTRNFLPVIDDRAGRARASTLMAQQQPGWSLDLLRHPDVLRSLGDAHATEALYLALRDGLMHVPPDTVDSIIAIIGQTRARECRSLPGYRNMFPLR